VREISVDRLQTTLIEQGAELGQGLGDPNPELIERIGVLPHREPATTGDRDAASMAETAWVR
jgi:hypothetical protein